MNKIVNNPPFEEEGGTASAVETEVEKTPELEEEQSVETTEEEIVEEEAPAEEEAAEETVEEKPVLTKIGDREYTVEELQEIVAKGSKIKEWETKMPGFDVDKLMPDYTRKSQELARLTKTKPAEKKETLEELGMDETQIKLFERAAKHLGFVKQTDLVENSIEAQKDIFISHHKEYTPGTPEADAKWASLMSEFSLYNWQAHPERVEELLEKTHKEISKTIDETVRGAQVLNTIATKKAQATANSLGGGSGKSTIQPAAKVSPSLVEKYRQAGWSEADIKELLI